MNEQQGFYGQIDIDKLWSMINACPELIKTYTSKDGTEHHVVNVNVGYRKQPSQSGNVAYIQISCKAAERKYDAGAYYIGDLKQSNQNGGGTGNRPPMATNAPWGAPAAPMATTPPPQQAPMQAQAQNAPTPPVSQFGQQQAAPQYNNSMPFPPGQQTGDAPF